MLSQAKNELLTRVGRGTPMGELMRRYWHPIAAVAELDDNPVKPVRLMGEDLVLYKDLGGNYGLVQRRCPHRNADLSYGYVEECGLRCNYHGWLFDHEGACRQQPYEEMVDPESRFKEKIRMTAYPVEAKAGMLWAYMGPEPRPLVPNWEPFTWKNGFVQVVFATIPCNWFQCQENSIDPVHFEWMHSNWSQRLAGDTGPYSPTHIKIAFEEIDYGFVYKRVRADTDEDHPLWQTGRVCLWPNALFTGNHFEWRVPIDDTRTLSVTWMFSRVPQEREPYVQERVPYWTGPIEDSETGRWITSHIMNQDFIAWVGQGEITDRAHEHLGQSDRGVIMMRKRFEDDMKAVERGEEPKAVIRDPAQNECLDLPIIDKAHFVTGMSLADREAKPLLARNLMPTDYIYQAGQPDHVRREYEEVMGFKTAPVKLVRV